MNMSPGWDVFCLNCFSSFPAASNSLFFFCPVPGFVDLVDFFFLNNAKLGSKFYPVEMVGKK